MARSRLGIGWSSNLAQLAQSYRFTELCKPDGQRDDAKIKELYDIVIIMAVLAQIIIDSSKRDFEIVGIEEILRIQNLPCMKYYKTFVDDDGKSTTYKCDLPKFMEYTKEIARTKNGNAVSYDSVKRSKDKLKKRINYDFVCPMNWLVECLRRDNIKSIRHEKSIETKEFFVKCKETSNYYKMSKVVEVIEQYDTYTKLRNNTALDNESFEDVSAEYMQMSEQVLDKIKSLKLGFRTVNRIVETALGLESSVGIKKGKQGSNKKYSRKLLNAMYRCNKEHFLNCFKKQVKTKKIDGTYLN